MLRLVDWGSISLCSLGNSCLHVEIKWVKRETSVVNSNEILYVYNTVCTSESHCIFSYAVLWSEPGKTVIQGYPAVCWDTSTNPTLSRGTSLLHGIYWTTHCWLGWRTVQIVQHYTCWYQHSLSRRQVSCFLKGGSRSCFLFFVESIFQIYIHMSLLWTLPLRFKSSKTAVEREALATFVAY